MKKLLLVAVTMLAFTFQSNAQDTIVDTLDINPIEIGIGSGFELGAGISLPMFDFGDDTKTGYNLRASYVLGDSRGNGNGVVLGGIYNKNSSETRGVENTMKILEFGLQFSLGSNVRLQTLFVGGEYSLDVRLDGVDYKLIEDKGFGYDVRFIISINETGFISANLLKMSQNGYGVGFFSLSGGFRF
jgi:hypothetical protein